MIDTDAGKAILEKFRGAFADLTELDKRNPDEVDEVLRMFIAHTRSWRAHLFIPTKEADGV